jgi:hypothetical protein
MVRGVAILALRMVFYAFLGLMVGACIVLLRMQDIAAVLPFAIVFCLVREDPAKLVGLV